MSSANQSSHEHGEISVGMTEPYEKSPEEDLSQRGQWLRAAVLGANDGLVSVASLMMGVGAVRQDIRAMLIAGFAGLFAGAFSMAIGEFVSVYTQRDVEKAQMRKSGTIPTAEKLPNPVLAAFASAMSFTAGAAVPLLAAAFIRDHKARVGVVSAAASLALVVIGWLSGYFGGTRKLKSTLRVLFGGWIAMGITFGLTLLIDTKVLRKYDDNSSAH